MRIQSRFLLSVGAFVCLSLLGLPAFAQKQAPAAPAAGSTAYKIGVVNRKEIFDAYRKTKTEYDKLQAEVDTRQKKVDELSAQIDKAKKDYDAKKDAMSDTARDELKAKVESDYRLYKSEYDRLQRDIDSMEMRVVKTIFGEIDEAIRKVGADGNYHLVLDGTPKESGGGVIYFSTTLNMTQKVIDYINSHDMSKTE